MAFQLIEIGNKPPDGSKLSGYHIIYEIKIDITRKPRLVANENINKGSLVYVTHATVASRESIILVFLLAILKGLNVIAEDDGNVYINFWTRNKVHIYIGP